MNTTPEQERDSLIDRYLNGKLTLEEKAEFEVRMMDDSQLLEEVHIAEGLKSALRAQRDALLAGGPADEGQQLANHAAIIKTRGVSSFNHWVRQPFSLAASALIASLGLHMLFIRYNDSIRITVGDQDAMAVGTILLLEATRGNEPLRFSGPPPYLLQIDIGLGADSNVFDVALRDVTTRSAILEEVGLRANPDGWLRLFITQDLEGEVVVEVKPSSNGAQLRSYTLYFDNP